MKHGVRWAGGKVVVDIQDLGPTQTPWSLGELGTYPDRL